MFFFYLKLLTPKPYNFNHHHQTYPPPPNPPVLDPKCLFYRDWFLLYKTPLPFTMHHLALCVLFASQFFSVASETTYSSPVEILSDATHTFLNLSSAGEITFLESMLLVSQGARGACVTEEATVYVNISDADGEVPSVQSVGWDGATVEVAYLRHFVPPVAVVVEVSCTVELEVRLTWGLPATVSPPAPERSTPSPDEGTSTTEFMVAVGVAGLFLLCGCFFFAYLKVQSGKKKSSVFISSNSGIEALNDTGFESHYQVGRQ